MKVETRKVYVAFDGKSFESAAVCREHENDHLGTALAKLSAVELDKAIYGPDTDGEWELADLIERAGKLCERKRLEAGRRHRAAPAEGDAGGTDG